MDWIIANKEWLFSGVFVAVIGFLINLIYKRYFEDKPDEKTFQAENNARIRGSNHSITQKAKVGSKNSLDLDGDNIRMEQSRED